MPGRWINISLAQYLDAPGRPSFVNLVFLCGQGERDLESNFSAAATNRRRAEYANQAQALGLSPITESEMKLASMVIY